MAIDQVRVFLSYVRTGQFDGRAITHPAPGESLPKEGTIQEIYITDDGQVVVHHSLAPELLRINPKEDSLQATGNGETFQWTIGENSWFFLLVKPMLAPEPNASKT